MANEYRQMLKSPDGTRTWVPESPAQATNLRARGWVPVEEPAPAQQAQQAPRTAPKAPTRAATPKSDK